MDFLERFFDRQSLPQNNSNRSVDIANVRGRASRPFQADLVGSFGRGPMTLRDCIGKDVLIDERTRRDEGIFSESSELSHAYRTANDDIAFDNYMPRKLREISEYGRVRDLTVMTYVGVGQNKGVVTDSSHSAAFLAAEIERGDFADAVVVPYHETRLGILVTPVLWRTAKSGAALNKIVLADHDFAKTTSYPDVRFDNGARTDLHFTIDYGVRADLCLRRDPSLLRDDGCRVNFQSAATQLRPAGLLIHESVLAGKSPRRR